MSSGTNIDIKKDPSEAADDQQQAAHKKPHRTTGLRLFDIFLYPFLTNFVVFAISVAATYLTSKGDTKNAAGKYIFGEFGVWMRKRGTDMDNWLKNRFGMGEKSAEMSRTVFFSFADGSLFAPFVKLLEDRREKIGKWIDERLGTKPNDMSAYAEEPKQNWASVIWGRVATFAVVFPTAVILDKFHIKAKVREAPDFMKAEEALRLPKVEKFVPLNDFMFRNPGQEFGWHVQKNNPKLVERFKDIDINMLSRVSIFEFFYTSVCTTGLYFLSRSFARDHNMQEKPATKKIEHKPIATTATGGNSQPLEQPDEGKPQPKVKETVAMSRLAAAPEHSQAVT